MLNNITADQIVTVITSVAALVSGALYLKGSLKRWTTSALKGELDGIEGKIESLELQLEKAQVESCKNFLVSYLSEVEKGKKIDDTSNNRFWEQYEYYISRGHNGYIKRKAKKLIKAKKL